MVPAGCFKPFLIREQCSFAECVLQIRERKHRPKSPYFEGVQTQLFLTLHWTAKNMYMASHDLNTSVLRKGIQRVRVAYQRVPRDNRPPEFAGVNAAKEEILLCRRISVGVHHHDSPQLCQSFYLQHPCSATWALAGDKIGRMMSLSAAVYQCYLQAG